METTERERNLCLECGDLSPLLPLWRLVAKAGPRAAARERWTPSRIPRRQVACRKRGQVRALQSRCGCAALCPLRPWRETRLQFVRGLLLRPAPQAVL